MNCAIAALPGLFFQAQYRKKLRFKWKEKPRTCCLQQCHLDQIANYAEQSDKKRRRKNCPKKSHYIFFAHRLHSFIASYAGFFISYSFFMPLKQSIHDFNSLEQIDCAFSNHSTGAGDPVPRNRQHRVLSRSILLPRGRQEMVLPTPPAFIAAPSIP
jgi:hypothetical protein